MTPREGRAGPSRGRRLGSDIGAYGLGLVLARLSSVAVLPVVARAVEPALLGTFASLSSAMLIVYVVLADFGLGEAALRLGSEGDESERAALFHTVAWARLVLGAVVGGLLMVFASPLSRLLTGSDAVAKFAPVVAASVLIGAVARALTDYLRSLDRHHTVALGLGALTLGENALMLILALTTQLDLSWLLLSKLAAQLVSLALLAWPARGLLRAKLRGAALRRLFVFGFPLGVFHLLIAVRGVDRIAVARLSTLFDAGCYDVAARFAAPVALSNVALNMTLEPLAYRLHTDPGAKLAIADFVRAYVLLFGLAAFSISVLAPELFALVAPAYASGTIVVPALLFVDVAEGIQRVAGMPGELAKRTRLWLAVVLVNAALSLGSMPLFVPRFGPAGAALALLVGAIAGALVASIFARRVHPARPPVSSALWIVVLGAGLASLALGAGGRAPLPLWMRLVAIGLFAALSWFLSGASVAMLRRRARELLARRSPHASAGDGELG